MPFPFLLVDFTSDFCKECLCCLLVCFPKPCDLGRMYQIAEVASFEEFACFFNFTSLHLHFVAPDVSLFLDVSRFSCATLTGVMKPSSFDVFFLALGQVFPSPCAGIWANQISMPVGFGVVVKFGYQVSVTVSDEGSFCEHVVQHVMAVGCSQPSVCPHGESTGVFFLDCHRESET